MELWQLQQLQKLPLEIKIKKTQKRIEEWYEAYDGNVYVSRSGGKDSDVLGHIVQQMYPNVPQIFIDTGLEHDSVREHGIDIAEKVLTPKDSFRKVITEFGYPVISKEVAQTIYEARIGTNTGGCNYRMKQLNGTSINKKTGQLSRYNIPQYKYLLEAPFRISHKCCDIMKKNPAKLYEKETGRKAFLGTLASESWLRKQKWIKHGCNAFNSGRPTSQPLSFWTEQDILHYIVKNQISIAAAYGDIEYTDQDGLVYDEPLFMPDMELKTSLHTRTGCVFCMFGIKYDTEKFLKLKAVEPLKYDFVMRGGKFDEKGMWIPYKGLGYKFVIDWLNENGNLNIKY